MACQWACSLTCLPYVLTTAVNGCHSIRVFVQTTTANICIDNDSFLSSISMLMMRLLQDSSRPLCFWSLHQSWSSRYFSLSGLPWHCPSRSSSVSLCFSFPLHVHVKLHLAVFSPPNVPHQLTTTVVSFS